MMFSWVGDVWPSTTTQADDALLCQLMTCCFWLWIAKASVWLSNIYHINTLHKQNGLEGWQGAFWILTDLSNHPCVNWCTWAVYHSEWGMKSFSPLQLNHHVNCKWKRYRFRLIYAFRFQLVLRMKIWLHCLFQVVVSLALQVVQGSPRSSSSGSRSASQSFFFLLFLGHVFT